MTNFALAIGFLVVLFLLPGCGIFGGNDGMNGLFDIDPENACSIVLAEADADAGITFIGTRIMIDGYAYVRRGSCTTTEIAMFKTVNRL